MSKRKSKRNDGGFLSVPKIILRNPNFLMLTTKAARLLLDLGEQYNGSNNGDLCATWSMMRQRGWRSPETLNNALRELEYYGFIHMTQQGGLNRPSLYAIAWFSIDINRNGLSVSLSQRSNGWKETKKKFKSKKQQVRISCANDTSVVPDEHYDRYEIQNTDTTSGSI